MYHHSFLCQQPHSHQPQYAPQSKKRLFLIPTPPFPPPPSPTAKMSESTKPSWKDPYTLTAEEMSVFLPPVNRAMRTLDRNFFRKTIPLVAAHIFDSKNIGKFQKECAKDILRLPRTKTIVEKDAVGGVIKLLLLRPGVKIDGNNTRRVELRGILELTISTTDLSTAGEKTREFIQSKILELLPYTLDMTYENWSYCTLTHLPPAIQHKLTLAHRRNHILNPPRRSHV